MAASQRLVTRDDNLMFRLSSEKHDDPVLFSSKFDDSRRALSSKSKWPGGLHHSSGKRGLYVPVLWAASQRAGVGGAGRMHSLHMMRHIFL